MIRADIMWYIILNLFGWVLWFRMPHVSLCNVLSWGVIDGHSIQTTDIATEYSVLLLNVCQLVSIFYRDLNSLVVSGMPWLRFIWERGRNSQRAWGFLTILRQWHFSIYNRACAYMNSIWAYRDCCSTEARQTQARQKSQHKCEKVGITCCA